MISTTHRHKPRFCANSAIMLLGLLVGAALLAPGQGSCAQYVYDAAGRLVRVTASNGTIVDYSYDAAGNRKQITATAIPDVSLQTQSGVTVTAPSGYYSTRVPANALALDSAYFTAALTTGSAVDQLQYDFGAVKWITSIALKTAYWGDSVAGVAQVTAYGSSNGTSWTSLGSFSLSGLSYQNYGPISVNTSYRYIKLRPTSFANNGYFDINQFDVVGH